MGEFVRYPSVDAARLAARPARPSFSIGFITGQELEWLTDAMSIPEDERPDIVVATSCASIERNIVFG